MALFAGYEGGFGHMVDPSYLKGQTPDKLSTCAMKNFFFKTIRPCFKNAQ